MHYLLLYDVVEDYATRWRVRPWTTGVGALAAIRIPRKEAAREGLPLFLYQRARRLEH